MKDGDLRMLIRFSKHFGSIPQDANPKTREELVELAGTRWIQANGKKTFYKILQALEMRMSVGEKLSSTRMA